MSKNSPSPLQQAGLLTPEKNAVGTPLIESFFLLLPFLALYITTIEGIKP